MLTLCSEAIPSLETSVTVNVFFQTKSGASASRLSAIAAPKRDYPENGRVFARKLEVTV
jgi:hypothetical protein